jgi:hypothetical protein
MPERKKRTDSEKGNVFKLKIRQEHLPFLVGLLIFACVLIILHFSIVRSVETLPLKVVVNRTGYDYGIAISSSELDFGEMPIEGVSRKFISVNNAGGYLAFVRFDVEGNISEFIDVSRNNILLSPGEKVLVDVKLNATRYGSYSGTLVITKLQAKNQIGQLYLKSFYSG